MLEILTKEHLTLNTVDPIMLNYSNHRILILRYMCCFVI